MRGPKTLKKAMAEQKDALFTYPASHNKESLTLRSIHFLLEDGNTEYLVTNLMPEQMAVENFPDLYRLRWRIMQISAYGELKANTGSLKTGLKQKPLTALNPSESGRSSLRRCIYPIWLRL